MCAHVRTRMNAGKRYTETDKSRNISDNLIYLNLNTDSDKNLLIKTDFFHEYRTFITVSYQVKREKKNSKASLKSKKIR